MAVTSASASMDLGDALKTVLRVITTRGPTKRTVTSRFDVVPCALGTWL